MDGVVGYLKTGGELPSTASANVFGAPKSLRRITRPPLQTISEFTSTGKNKLTLPGYTYCQQDSLNKNVFCSRTDV